MREIQHSSFPETHNVRLLWMFHVFSSRVMGKAIYVALKGRLQCSFALRGELLGAIVIAIGSYCTVAELAMAQLLRRWRKRSTLYIHEGQLS